MDHEDNDKATPLHTAAQAGQIEVIRKLVRVEIYPNHLLKSAFFLRKLTLLAKV